jgi:hypothetical protein
MFKFDLLENEKPIAVYRQTEAVLFKPAIIIFLLLYIPWFFLLKYELASNYLYLMFYWTLLVFLYGVNKYVLWLLNVYILTNQRLIQVKYKNFFNKEVLECPLKRILNISFAIKGLWQVLFQYGNIEVQVAGLPEAMKLKNLSHPSQIKDFLWQTHARYGSGQVEGSELAHEILVHKAKS